MSSRHRTQGARQLPADVLASSLEPARGRAWRPLGDLARARSPNGGWFPVMRGIQQHYRAPPSADEVAAERAWLKDFRKQQRKNGKAHL
jgi:hypothetical protein